LFAGPVRLVIFVDEMRTKSFCNYVAAGGGQWGLNLVDEIGRRPEG